ncbi:MAG: hypothetical protein ACE5JF_09240 [Anaerolineales bacterium]
MSEDAVASPSGEQVATARKALSDDYVLLRLAGLGMLYLFYRAFTELVEIGTGSGSFVGDLSTKWFIGLAGYGAAAIIGAIVCSAAVLQPHRLISFYDRGIVHQLPNGARWAIATALVLLPSALLLGEWGRHLTTPAFRTLLLSSSAIAAGLIVSPNAERLLPRIALAFIASATVFAVGKRLALLTDYPFKLFWSEGNRLWDYSLYYALDRYQLAGEFTLPTYMAPGRHGLWGLPYLLPGVGIVLVRLWDHLLWLLPYFLLGWLFYSMKWAQVSKLQRFALSLWSLLYLAQGGIFAPLILSVALLAWGLNPSRLWRVAFLAAATTFYAGISRWTWALAPAMYATLWMLLDDPSQRERTQRLQAAVIVGSVGLLGGLGSQAFMSLAFPRPDSVFSTALSQPLLWYRLLPNATNPQGILIELLLAASPLLLFLIWLGSRSRAGWGWLERGALALGLVATLAVGIAASIKIGGGNNIHNLDMFLVLLFLAVGWAGMSWARTTKPAWSKLPVWMQGVVALAVIVPGFVTVRTGGPQFLLAEAGYRSAMEVVRAEVEGASGEVLFIDQRQLLTFGHVEGVQLVGEYELKDMMNQAMRGNEAYFEKFSDDLQKHRFALIISDPLPSFLRGSDFEFGEENDAWLRYVASPLQRYYEPLHRIGEVDLWIMAPKR